MVGDSRALLPHDPGTLLLEAVAQYRGEGRTGNVAGFPSTNACIVATCSAFYVASNKPIFFYFSQFRWPAPHTLVLGVVDIASFGTVLFCHKGVEVPLNCDGGPEVCPGLCEPSHHIPLVHQAILPTSPAVPDSTRKILAAKVEYEDGVIHGVVYVQGLCQGGLMPVVDYPS